MTAASTGSRRSASRSCAGPRFPGPRFGTAGLALTLVVAAAPAPVQARTLFEEGELTLELRTAFKSSLLLSVPYEMDPVLFPDRPAGAALFRLRFDAIANITPYLTAAAAYEHRVRSSSGGAIGVGLLPPTAPVPFRLTPLDWVLVDGGNGYVHQHELDRFYVSLHLDFMELTVGRQAIGLGRGQMFSAVDVFAPFAPTEVDREWRRGVDAVHLELRVPEISELSADVFVAFESVQDDELTGVSAFGRIRAIVGDVDGAFILGRRGEDDMVGLVLSANLGDAEAHGELAFFGTDGRGVDGGFLGTRGVVVKGLIGGSYVIDVGTGLTVAIEYHYSGFGVENVGARPDVLFDPAFQARFARGDSQTLGRHALALTMAYALVDEVMGALAYIQSPVDGSGMVAPTVTWTLSDHVTLILNLLVPWGTPPESGVPTSEWGASPFTVFVQARIYD